MEIPAPQARIRPLAAKDLEQAVQFLDARSSTASDQLLEAFFQASNLLAEMPRLGPVRRRRGRLKGLRSWPLTKSGPYVIFYIPIQNGIEVVRVLHGARDVDRELRQ
jgi:toxin ParE1/3/4